MTIEALIRRVTSRVKWGVIGRRLALAGSLAALIYVAREPLLIGAARLVTVDTVDGPADYLIVMGGSVQDRPFAAADLFNRGVAPKVVLYEYPAPPTGLTSQTDLYARVLIAEGVPPAAIERAGGIALSSWDEAMSLRRFLQNREGKRIVVVTSAEHTRRAGWTFRRALRGLGIDVRVSPARHPDYDETSWWHHDEGVLLYLHEYLKLPFYVVRYAIPFGG